MLPKWCKLARISGTAHPPPKKNSISLLWMSWLLSIPIILMSAFAGQLKASMMFKPEKPKIHNLLDLYNSQHDVYLAKDSAGESALKVTKFNLDFAKWE